MHAEDIDLPVADGRVIRAHLARPDDAKDAPAVMVLHEIMGLNDDIRRITQRFAQQGYVALAPDSFTGLGPMPFCIARCMGQIKRGEGPVVADALAAREWLMANAQTDGKRVGVIGFCMGGGFALLLGGLGEFGAAAPFYGDMPKNDDTVKQLCPVVGGYGSRDLHFARKARKLKTRLTELGIPHDVQIYDGVGHSFMSEQPLWAAPLVVLSNLTPFKWGHDADAAQDSWKRVLGFFDEHL